MLSFFKYKAIKRVTGFTLIELLVVILLLSIIAISVTPSSSSNNHSLDLVTSEVMHAIRFVRNEAIRTQQVHAISINPTTQKIIAYKADLTGAVIAQEYILRDPITKQNYDKNISDISPLVTLHNAQDPFLFPIIGQQTDLAFDQYGSPIWIDLGSTTTYQLEYAAVIILHKNNSSTVRVEPLTGKVSIE